MPLTRVHVCACVRGGLVLYRHWCAWGDVFFFIGSCYGVQAHYQYDSLVDQTLCYGIVHTSIPNVLGPVALAAGNFLGCLARPHSRNPTGTSSDVHEHVASLTPIPLSVSLS